MQAMEGKYLCDLRKLKLAHKNELELLESDRDALNDLVADFKKKYESQTIFPCRQSVSIF